MSLSTRSKLKANWQHCRHSHLSPVITPVDEFQAGLLLFHNSNRDYFYNSNLNNKRHNSISHSSSSQNKNKNNKFLVDKELNLLSNHPRFYHHQHNITKTNTSNAKSGLEKQQLYATNKQKKNSLSVLNKTANHNYEQHRYSELSQSQNQSLCIAGNHAAITSLQHAHAHAHAQPQLPSSAHVLMPNMYLPHTTTITNNTNNNNKKNQLLIQGLMKQSKKLARQLSKCQEKCYSLQRQSKHMRKEREQLIGEIVYLRKMCQFGLPLMTNSNNQASSSNCTSQAASNVYYRSRLDNEDDANEKRADQQLLEQSHEKGDQHHQHDQEDQKEENKEGCAF